MKYFIAILLLFGASFQPARAADTYTLDPDHTNVVWHVVHFGFSSPSGKFTGVEGKLVLDEKNPEKSTLSVAVKPANVLTGIPKLDEHLRSADFFDVEKFPVATFVSDKIELTGKQTAKVHGTFTLHGIPKPLVLDVKFNKIGEISVVKRKKAGFSATTTLKRSDFGMNFGIPDVSDEVRLEIESEAWFTP
jgi:polyisoprenoid-binding protein YceI